MVGLIRTREPNAEKGVGVDAGDGIDSEAMLS